jgi:HEAT repeat protein
MYTVGTRWPVLVVCWLLAFCAAGCASWRDKKDRLPGVIPPAERTVALRKLAEEARSADAARKQKIAEDLAQQIRQEGDPLMRAEIVRTLGECPGPTADNILRAATGDPEADVRVAACEAWGKPGHAGAATALAGLVSGDTDKDVRLAAARALGQSRDPAAIVALGGALEDKDPAMQYRAVLSLRAVTGQNLGNDVNRWREYVKSGTAKPLAEPSSIAERFRRMF